MESARLGGRRKEMRDEGAGEVEGRGEETGNNLEIGARNPRSGSQWNSGTVDGGTPIVHWP
eukprot:3254614-Pyramimonas_sp.AAC.1